MLTSSFVFLRVFPQVADSHAKISTNTQRANGKGTEKGGEGEFKLEEEKLGGEMFGCRKILRR